ncbi:hypothetical protein BJP34_13750 [Moorena producens PAL-8-15-08-1]|uniref:Uncharacterized protein n=1 Tax=Moorena producens PAL-8-15-08-1 TaxID=1458985 RepID=A0A1D8TS34_9CYAN|nr:hypothetical protein BJP34_13750 [Moorena producens PAL-8-15-08-1]
MLAMDRNSQGSLLVSVNGCSVGYSYDIASHGVKQPHFPSTPPPLKLVSIAEFDITNYASIEQYKVRSFESD